MQETEVYGWLESFCMGGQGWELFRKPESGYEIFIMQNRKWTVTFWPIMPMCLGYCGAIYKYNIQGLGVLQQYCSVRGDQVVVQFVLVSSGSIAIWLPFRDYSLSVLSTWELSQGTCPAVWIHGLARQLPNLFWEEYGYTGFSGL